MKNWTCGWCHTGRHDRCKGRVPNQDALLACGCCGDQPEKCNSCQSAEDVSGWQCVDRGACADRLAARSAANPLREELATVIRLGGIARRRALHERTVRQIRTAVAACGIDDEIGHDVAADLPLRRPRRPSAPKQPTACMCGCGGLTKGGRFQPGHDMKLKGRLQRAASGGDFDAVARLRDLGWKVPEDAPTHPELALAG